MEGREPGGMREPPCQPCFPAHLAPGAEKPAEAPAGRTQVQRVSSGKGWTESHLSTVKNCPGLTNLRCKCLELWVCCGCVIFASIWNLSIDLFQIKQ